MKMKFLAFAALAAFVAILAAPSPPVASGKSGCVLDIVSTQENYLGMSYGEWSVAWAQWAFSLPFEGHPLYNGDAAQGQGGKVWFLGGTIWPNNGIPPEGVVTRTLTIPAGTALFFPVVNCTNEPIELPGYSVGKLHQWNLDWLNENIKSEKNMYATIDGKKVHNLMSYYTSTGSFSLQLPESDNLFYGWYGAPVGAEVVYPTVSDGYYLMVPPLPVGQHTITFGVKNLPWHMDLVYDITVQP